MAVRRLEWRRFGFGIADSFQAFSLAVGQQQPEIAITLRFHPAAEIGQRCPPRIDLASIAIADFGIAIPSTAGAESFALLLAERSGRQG